MIKLRLKYTGEYPVIVGAGSPDMDFGPALGADEAFVVVDRDDIPDDIHYAWTWDGKELVRRPTPLTPKEYEQCRGIAEIRLENVIAQINDLMQRVSMLERALTR